MELGPFIVQSRLASKIVKERLNKMRFPTVGAWTYDPKGIILQFKDLAGKKSIAENPYHEPQPLIERLANKVSFLQTKENRSKTEEDLEQMMQIITGSQRR